MDADEAVRRQLDFQICHRPPRQLATKAAMQLDVISGRAHPVDLARAQHHNPAAVAHLDQRRLPGLRGRGRYGLSHHPHAPWRSAHRRFLSPGRAYRVEGHPPPRALGRQFPSSGCRAVRHGTKA